MTCRPIVWDGASGKGPEAMTFTPDSGEPFDIFAVSRGTVSYWDTNLNNLWLKIKLKRLGNQNEKIKE